MTTQQATAHKQIAALGFYSGTLNFTIVGEGFEITDYSLATSEHAAKIREAIGEAWVVTKQKHWITIKPAK